VVLIHPLHFCSQIQNPLQRGLTEAIPMLFAAFIASEVIDRWLSHFTWVVIFNTIMV
jgi:hypothetical protein